LSRYYQGGNKRGNPGAKSLWGKEKFQQGHKYFLQYSTFAFEKPHFRTWGVPNLHLALGTI